MTYGYDFCHRLIRSYNSGVRAYDDSESDDDDMPYCKAVLKPPHIAL